MKTWRSLLVGCTLAVGLLLVAPVTAQQPAPACTGDVQYFPETGHNVCDRFLDFFSARGGAGIFGYPITERIIEDGRLVQYFQRVRMEYHPELSPSYQVQLGLLGDYFAPPAAKTRIPVSQKPKSNDPESRYFPETGHTVQFGFLKFFNTNGGVDIFGYPITEFILENGRTVQYFQRALMEWDPNQKRVLLHNLGEMWVDQHPALQRLTEPAPQLAPSGASAPPAATISALRADASVRHAFTSPDDQQTVWVYVYDQHGGPLQGADVTLIASFFPDRSVIPMTPTDEMGHTQIDFPLEALTPGQLVIVEAQVSYQGLTTRARAFFFAWW
jgi:hypothetical protein